MAQSTSAPVATSTTAREIAFLNGGLDDLGSLLKALPSSIEGVVLDEGREGLQQVADYLHTRHGLDAIHLLSHGAKGAVQVGNTWLTGDNLGEHQAALQSIGAALGEEGDLLLYGCNVAEDEDGLAFINALAQVTGGQVAASTNPTGAAALGGDSVLEAWTGTGAVVPLDLSSYAGLLAAPVSLNFDQVPVTDGYSLGGSPRTFDAWTVRLLTADGTDAPSYGNGLTPSNLDVLQDGQFTDLAGVGDGALFVDGWVDVVKSAQFSATSGAEFWLQSFVFHNKSSEPSFRVDGYRDGVVVAQQNFTESKDDETFATIMLDAVTNPQWKNIDEFRIVQQDGSADLQFWMDDIVVAAAVLPSMPPVIANLNGDSTPFIEGSTPALLDVDSNATVTDADSASFDGGTLTVSISANKVPAEDILGIVNQGIAAGQIGVSGSNVTFAGTTIGTFAGGTGSNDLVVTFNASSSPAAATALLHAISYSNSNQNQPSTAARTVSITVSDGAGGTSTVSTVTVNVTGVNDAPTVTATSANTTYTENGSAALLFSGATISTIETGQNIRELKFTVANVADGGSERLVVNFHAELTRRGCG